MEKLLCEQLPILEVSDDCIVSKMGDVTVGFEVIKPEIFTLSAANYEALHQSWVKAIRVLAPNTVLHMQDWYILSSYEADWEKPDDSFLSRASEGFFHERPWLDHHCRLYLTRKPARRSMGNTASSSLLRRSLVPEDTLDPSAQREFLEQVSQFERILSDCAWVKFRQLTTEELSGDEHSAGAIEQYCQLIAPGSSGASGPSAGGWRRHPECRDIELGDGARTGSIRIGDQHCVLYTLADAEKLPPQCSSRIDYEPYSTDRSKFSIGFASSLGPLLSCNHIYNQYIFLEDAPAAMKKLEAKRLRLQSLANYSRENALAKEAVGNFITEAISEQRTPIRAHFNVLAWTDEPADVKDLKNKISSAIARMEATPHPETVGAATVWWAGIPGNAADLPMNETFYSFVEQAACLLIPETNYRTSISPFGMRLGDRITGRPLHVDISDEPMHNGAIANRNKFVLGGSGSGKSFFMNHLVRSYYEQGVHIVIVDIGNSYTGLCKFVEGYYFAYTEKKPICFNPFWLPEGEILDTEKKESIKTLLLALWKKDDEAFLRSEYVALSNALQLYYEMLTKNKEVFPCFNSFYEFLQEEFVLVLANDRVKEKDFDISNLLYVLRPFYMGGEYDYLLNAHENLDLLRQRFIVFELDAIANNPILFPVVTIILAEIFISKMRKLPGIRKLICIEEAWKAIARQGMSEYIKYLFKTVRKFFGEAIVVTQEIEDIISSPIVKQAIINNADCKILLDQSKFQNRFDQIQDLLGLSEKDKSLILSVNKDNDPALKYKEVFISLGNSCSKVYRIEVSLEECLTYTTEEREKIKVQEYADRYGSFRKGVEMLAAEVRAGTSAL